MPPTPSTAPKTDPVVTGTPAAVDLGSEGDTGSGSTYYAWSRILYGAEFDDKTNSKVKDLYVELGDTVTASQLGISDDDFQALVNEGAIRDYELPDELIDPLASPNQLIAKGLSDTETVASTLGTSPQLVK